MGNAEFEIKRKENTQEKVLESKESKEKTRRSPTMLKLGWLAERLRKVERIKKMLASGEYKPDSEDVAKSILGVDVNKDNK